jgi:hypothetical protein
MFSTDGEGHWTRREWKEQCPEKVFMAKRCQGVKGHKDVHWCYQPSGCLAWDDNKDDPKHDGCSGSTPPDHEKYITPLEMLNKLWLNHFTDTEVTEPEEIARLERDEIKDGESINRPCSHTFSQINQH